MPARFLLLLLLLFSGSLAAQVQLAPKRELQALRIAEKITVDAEFNEPAWLKAAPATDFLFSWPTPGKPASQLTVVKVLYDDNALYVAFYCYDSRPDSIFHRLTKRDALENSDHASIILDTYQDGQNAVQFGVSPDNVQYDNKYSRANADPNNDNADGRDPAWDAVWQSAARITADGWTAEFRIPYSALRFPKKDIQTWNVNFFRVVKRKGESNSWNEIKAEINGSLNQMGQLVGIQSIRAPLRLSATPFVATYAQQHYNQSAASGNGWNYPYSAGMDLKYGLNEAFTLDATLIPDFAQVRSDNQVLNLSPFEVRFQENRPFFTEGTELFNKGGLFYSRRVGARPVLYWEVEDMLQPGEEIVQNPDRARLINATKISGRTRSGLGIGVFNAVEGDTYAEVRNTETGESREIETAPWTNKNIVVFDQNLKNNSAVTLLNSTVWRAGHARDAVVTALVYNLKNKAQSYALSGKTAVSNRMEGGNTETGFTTSASLSRTSGNWLWGIDYNIESDKYNPNDLGFLLSANESSGNVWINYNRYTPWWKLNNYWWSFWVYNGALYKPAKWTETQFGGNIGGNTKSFHNGGIWFNYSPWGDHDYFEPRTDDFIHFYKRPSSYNIGFWYNTDHRKRFTFHADGGSRFFAEAGRRSLFLFLGPRWRATDKLTVGIGTGNDLAWRNVGWVSLDETAIGYDELPEGGIVLGHRNLWEINNTLEVSYSFTNRMNLALFARHYWQQVEYQWFDLLDEKGNLHKAVYTGKSAEGEGLNNIAVNFFNIDLVYTWRFAPGSDLVIVYKNGSSNEVYGRPASKQYLYNARHLPDYAGTNTISLKLLYFLDFGEMKRF